MPFARLDNVIMTPHSSGVTADTFRERAREIAENITRLDNNEPLINGAIRDCVAISSLALGVKALGTNAPKSTKEGTGEADVTLQLDTCTVRPGAMVYSDEDGILIER